jgi:hypothetical protein
MPFLEKPPKRLPKSWALTPRNDPRLKPCTKLQYSAGCGRSTLSPAPTSSGDGAAAFSSGGEAPEVTTGGTRAADVAGGCGGG